MLRRALFPGHARGEARVGPAFGPNVAMKAVWGPLLGAGGGSAAAVAAGSLDSESVESQVSAGSHMGPDSRVSGAGG
eukprot:1949637-Pyramimonas_sp.AAC.1